MEWRSLSLGVGVRAEVREDLGLRSGESTEEGVRRKNEPGEGNSRPARMLAVWEQRWPHTGGSLGSVSQT